MRESEVVSYIKHINDCLKKRANNSLRKEGLTLMQSHVLLKLQDAPDQRMTFMVFVFVFFVVFFFFVCFFC